MEIQDKRSRSSLASVWAISLCGAILGLPLGCGGGGGSTAPATPSQPATGLAYSNPASGGYQLVADAASTSTHLVLDLMGPSGAQLEGGIFTFTLDATKAAWGNPGGTMDPNLMAGTTLNLGTGTPLLKSQVSGGTLTGTIYQKGAVPAATVGSGTLATVAVDLKAGATTGSVGLANVSAQIVDGTGMAQTVSVAVGTLTAN